MPWGLALQHYTMVTATVVKRLHTLLYIKMTLILGQGVCGTFKNALLRLSCENVP
jgi:hypothetical protein